MSKAEQGVLERRLKPIYDALDLDNNKKAIQEAEKILKKHPNLVCAKVLKALALIRSERLTEGFAILDTYDVKGPSHDDLTLQAFVHCYKEAALPGRICRLYERAVDFNPTEHNLTQLFMSYVRVKDYKNQQQIAMKLYKDFSNGPYLCWAVMSIVMQAYISDPNLGKKMFFPLAEKMMSTYIAKNGYQSSANMELYLLILEGLERYGEAEQLLCSDTYKQFASSPPNHVMSRRLHLLFSDKNFTMTMERTVEALKENNDDWILWTLLFDTAFAVLSSDSSEGKKKLTLDEVVHAVTSHCSLGGKNRGPYMARLELLTRLLNKEESIRVNLGSRLGEPYDLMMAYFRRFSTKPCCFADMEKYLCLLSETQLLKFYNEVDKIANDIEDKDTENGIRPYIFVQRLRIKLGLVAKMSMSEKRNLCEIFMKMLQQRGNSGFASADIAQLAASILWKEWKENDDWQSFYEVILLLENIASDNSPDPFSKLVLCRAYGHIGNMHRLIALTTALDIKSMQKDTLGHQLFPLYILSGRFNHGIVHYTELTNMYTQAERDINESLIGAYKNGTFAQIKGLVELDDRMRNSSLAFGGDVTNRYLSGLLVMHDLNEIVNTFHGDDDPICWGSIADNRDITIIPSYESDDLKEEIFKHRDLSHTEFVAMVKLRHVLCQAVAALGKDNLTAGDVQKAVNAFTDLWSECKERYPKNREISRVMQSATPCRLELWLHCSSTELLVDFLNLAKEIITLKYNGGDSLGAFTFTDEEFVERMHSILIPTIVPTTPFTFQDNIYQLSFFVQSLAMIQIIVTIAERQQSAGNKPAFTERCQAILRSIKVFCKVLAARVCEFKKLLESCKDVFFPEISNDWSPNAAKYLKMHESMVRDRCFKSYEAALEDLRVFSLRLKERAWI